MSGNKAGGIRTAKTIEQRYGSGYWARIGRKGGSAPKTKPHGFLLLKMQGKEHLIAEAGKKGGQISRYTRRKKKGQVL